MQYLTRYSLLCGVTGLLIAACSDPAPDFTVLREDGSPPDTATEDEGPVFYDDITACEGVDCWCSAIQDCEALATATVHDNGSQLIHVCGYDGDQCFFRYEEEDEGAVSRYLCVVPTGRSECAFELELECDFIDLCVIGNCPTVDICATYESAE